MALLKDTRPISEFAFMDRIAGLLTSRQLCLKSGDRNSLLVV